MIKASLNGPWLRKMSILFVGCSVFMLWGLYDAVVAYPAKGRKHAEYARLQYLKASAHAGKLSAGVDDPVAVYKALQEDERELGNRMLEGSSPGRDAAQEFAKLQWLRALDRVGDLVPDQTRIESMRQEIPVLQEKWARLEQPKPLAGHDIPSQWVIFGGCAMGVLWMSLVLVRAFGTKPSYDQAEKRIVFADGVEVSPANLREIDARKWDKYYVTAVLADGKTRVFDLYRYKELEGWLRLVASDVQGAELPAPKPSEKPAQTTAESDKDTGEVETMDTKGTEQVNRASEQSK